MAELRTMAQDITKNSGDIENYSKEFLELQNQLRQVKEEKFNGISLFSISGSDVAGSKAQLTQDSAGVYVDAAGATQNYTKYGRELITHPSGNTGNGSISLNVVNLQFVLSLNGTANANINLGGINNTAGTVTATAMGGDNYITNIRDVFCL